MQLDSIHLLQRAQIIPLSSIFCQLWITRNALTPNLVTTARFWARLSLLGVISPLKASREFRLINEAGLVTRLGRYFAEVVVHMAQGQ